MGEARAPYHSSGRHRRVQHLCTRQGHCSGARGVAAAVDAAAAKAARDGALRAHKHTHTFTHFAGEGGTCRCLALHARAHSLSAHAHAQSVRGWAGLQVYDNPC